MTKILYKQYEIENNVVSELEKSRDKLKLATNDASQFVVPSDFEYSGYLNSLSQTFENYYSEYEAIDKWIKGCVKIFEDASTTVKEDFDSFVPIEIPVDTESINSLY